MGENQRVFGEFVTMPCPLTENILSSDEKQAVQDYDTQADCEDILIHFSTESLLGLADGPSIVNEVYTRGMKHYLDIKAKQTR